MRYVEYPLTPHPYLYVEKGVSKIIFETVMTPIRNNLMPTANILHCGLQCFKPRAKTAAMPQAAPGGDKGVTIGGYVREISVKARSMLGRPQPDVLGSSRRPMASDHTDHESDTRQDQMWGVRHVVSPELPLVLFFIPVFVIFWSLSVHRIPLQAYIGSRVAEEDADAELTSYTTFADGLPLLVDSTNEVISLKLSNVSEVQPDPCLRVCEVHARSCLPFMPAASMNTYASPRFRPHPSSPYTCPYFTEQARHYIAIALPVFCIVYVVLTEYAAFQCTSLAFSRYCVRFLSRFRRLYYAVHHLLHSSR